MKKLLFAVAVALAAVTTSAAEGAKLGVGTNIGPGAAVITVPINVTPVLRLEPFVGMDRVKVTDNTGATEVITTDSEYALGVGGYYVMQAAPSVELYAGGRLEIGFLSHKVKDGGTNTDSWNRYGIAAVGGAEYYFSPRFALGVEAELGLVTAEENDVRTTEISTGTFVTAKVFFK